MAHCHAGLSPAEARKIARQIERAAARNPVPYQYRVRVRSPEHAPLGAWVTLPGVYSDRKDAERVAKAETRKGFDCSITKGSTEGY